MEIKEVKIYPWNLSATRRLSVEELVWLRDEEPASLAERLWASGKLAQELAVRELGAHGNPRKGAEVVRGLVALHPECEVSLKEDLGGDLVDLILREDPEFFPSRSKEYPPDIRIEFIQ